jgi:hypothetical protein
MNHSIWACLLAACASTAAYAGLFVYPLGLKALRRVADTRGTEAWVVTEVVLGTVTLVLTLEALILIFFDRTLSGRFPFVSVFAGALLVGIGTAGILGPVKASLGLGHYMWIGLAAGGVAMITANVLCFFVKIPSLL